MCAIYRTKLLTWLNSWYSNWRACLWWLYFCQSLKTHFIRKFLKNYKHIWNSDFVFRKVHLTYLILKSVNCKSMIIFSYYILLILSITTIMTCILFPKKYIIWLSIRTRINGWNMDEIKNFGRLRLQTNGPHCLQIDNIPYNDSDHDNHLPTIILLAHNIM